MKKNYLLGVFFSIIFTALMALFWLGLGQDPNKLDLVIKDSKVPAFALPSLTDPNHIITQNDLKTDNNYYLINVWASWCPSCYEELSYLIQRSFTDTIYGLNWKDKSLNALRFLQRGGNPYTQIMVDNNSDLAILLGVYGAPETFLIKKDGTILYRYAGVMNEDVWQKEFEPRIKELEQ